MSERHELVDALSGENTDSVSTADTTGRTDGHSSGADSISTLESAVCAGLAGILLDRDRGPTVTEQHMDPLHQAAMGVRLSPGDGRACARLALALIRAQRYPEAAASYQHAIELGHQTMDVWSNLGAAQQALGDHAAAAASFQNALRCMPNSAVLLSNLGNALGMMGDTVAAEAACRQAVRYDPQLAAAHVNLGGILAQRGALDAAIKLLRKALVLKPGLLAAHRQLGMALLAKGDFPEGWVHYEHRLRLPAFLGRHLLSSVQGHAPMWDGRPLPNRTLMVMAEQGNGDIIQFARYVPLLRERCGRVVFRVPQRLARLFAGLGEISSGDEPLPRFDAYCPLMSLPHRLGTTLETIPGTRPYLHADPSRVMYWSSRLPHAPLRVGVAWQGNPLAEQDRGRSLPLASFAAVAAVPGVQLISLQVGEGVEQIDDVPFAAKIHRLGEAFDAGADAFVDTAAVMTQLDLVITSDTAIAHLAGALGRPVWVALRRWPEWRWLEDRPDSPWYPTARLFRQEQDRQWAPVFQRMATELQTMVTASGPRHSATADHADPLQLDPVAPKAVITVPMSPGDLVDRITILQVKADRLLDSDKRANVLRELGLLRQARAAADLNWGLVTDLEAQLADIHGQLWDTENTLRVCQRQDDFGETFVAAARAIVANNGRRARIKRTMNMLLDSLLVEEKVYG